jgi:hypothetical protein
VGRALPEPTVSPPNAQKSVFSWHFAVTLLDVVLCTHTKERQIVMATGTLEQRVETLESRLDAVQEQLAHQNKSAQPKKRGWRWFVGIDADNPHFEEAVRLGQEWRNADCPTDEETE